MNVGSWIFGENKPDENATDDTSESAPTPSTPTPTPPTEVLNAEELRRRRLNNTQLTATTPKVTVEDNASTLAVSSPSPKRSQATIEQNTTPQDKKKTKPLNSPLATGQAEAPSPKSTPSGAKLDRYARTLNLALEFIFQITVRQDNARANIQFVDTEGDSDFLTADNLEYLLPMRLMEIVQEGPTGPQQGTPCYLIRCYKRLLEKEGQALERDPMLKDFQG